MLNLFSGNFLVFVYFLLPSCAYVITTQPWQTDRPAPGFTLFYDIQIRQNDPLLVDILLFNSRRGNTTTIFGGSDLTNPDDRNGSFVIPSVPPGTYAIRLVETSTSRTKRFLQDSPPFQIFASDSTAVSTPSSTTLSTPSVSTTVASKSRNVGAIVGAVNGCVLFIVIAFAIIVWCRHSRKSIPTNKTENVLPKAASKGRPGIQSFVLHASKTSPVEFSGPKSGDAFKPYPSPVGIDSADRAGPSHKKMEATLNDAGSPSTTPNAAMSTRAAVLRQERERINREIASLEDSSTASEYGRSPYGTDLSSSSSHRYPMIPNNPPIPSINDQLASLREQIRQMEQAYGASASASMSEDPPPSYGAPRSGTINGGTFA